MILNVMGSNPIVRLKIKSFDALIINTSTLINKRTFEKRNVILVIIFLIVKEF